MDARRLANSPIGALVPITAPDPATRDLVSGHAFLPDPLPPSFTLSTETWTRVNAATAALARLDGAARLIPNASLLRRPAMRREAQSTSALEGTYAPVADVLAAQPDGANLSAVIREILNFEQIADLAFSWPEDRRLTLSMLGELQGLLVQGTAAELPDAGGLRDRVVIIGARGRSLAEARFVPAPPGDQLRAGVEDLLRWVAVPPDLPTVVQAAVTHYQFETLHPFSDGNGRIGRLLIIVQLLRGAIIREPLLIVSPWFERRRERYQDGLLQLSQDGDWDAWIAFFAEGVTAAAIESKDRVERLVTLQNELRDRVHRSGKRGAAERVAANLVGTPYVTVQDVADGHALTAPGATKIIRSLIDLGILEPASFRGRRGAQMYGAPDVLEVLQS